MAIQIQSPSLPPTSKVPLEAITKAVDALVKWMKSKSKQEKSQLFENDEFLYLILTLNKIPSKGRTNPYKIPLPNSLHPFDSSEELCLIIDDRSKSSLTSAAAKKKIQSENIPVSKVLKLTKLKSDYRPFEAKRKLCSSYDLFFADKRIIPLLPKCLGKEFFRKKKIPIPVDLSHKNWKEQIEGACGSALLYLRTGTCSVIKVGKVSQSRDEIVGNVVAAIEGVAEIVPKKWGNIRSFHLKLSESLALPIYQTVPEMGMKIEGVRKEEEKKVDSQAESGEESVGEGKGSKLGKRKKRGRIHEVQYMENSFEGEDLFSDKDEEDNDETDAKIESDGAELTGKKRKKGDKLKKEPVLDEVNGEKQLKKSPKAKKEVDKKKKSVSSEGKGEEQEVKGEAIEAVSVPTVKKSAKSKKDGTPKAKENVAADEVEVAKKKKSKVGSDGIKVKTKKTKKV
ncbi:hypothetical protein ACHQM5_022802 [Ranunculus cassubicifolius]